MVEEQRVWTWKQGDAAPFGAGPPLILLAILLTSSHKVMGKCVNTTLLRYLGWATFVVVTAAAVGTIIASMTISASD